MNKPLLLVGGLGLAALVVGVVAMSGGEAYAASSTEPALGNGSPAARALLALRSANAMQIQNAALVLSSEAPMVAAGLVKAADTIRGLDDVPLQYKAMTLQAISGLDVPSITAMAANLQNLRFQQDADDVRLLGQFVAWLKDGAAAPAIAATAATKQSVASVARANAAANQTGPVTPAQVVQVALAIDTTAQEAAKLAAIIATGDVSKMQAALDVYTRVGNQSAVDILRVAITEATRLKQSAQPAAQPAAAVQTAVTKAPEVVPAHAPTPSVEVPPDQSKRILAGKVALALKTATKDKNSGLPSPKSAAELTKQFQLQEELARIDGAYGTETGLSLAERYGIVPPTPLSWGKKGGNYQTLVDDKRAYKARLTKLRDADKPRREEWQRALDAVKV